MKSILCISALLLVSACKRNEGKAEEDHPHAPGADHAEAKAPERPTLAMTEYQNGLELFMEYPSLVVGMPSALVAHFTDARSEAGFQAVTQGQVTATLRYADGREERFVADKPLRDGIFKPEVKPSASGAARLTLLLEGQQIAGKLAVDVFVHPDEAASIAAAPAEGGGEQSVPFLKEQQWKTDYATTRVEPRVLQGGVRANGELKAVAGWEAELSAPVAGRVAPGHSVPYLGMRVKKGELLVRIIPTTVAGAADSASLELELSRARGELGLARRELERAEELFAQRAIAEKQLDAAKVARDGAAARVNAAERQTASFRNTQSGGAGGAGAPAFELRSPLDGAVAFANVTQGAVVEAGTRLVYVVNTERLWLEARVYEVDVPLVESSPGAAFTVAGFDQEFTVDEQSGRRVAVGAVVDRGTRTVPVVFELPNPGGALKPGMFAKVTLYTGKTIRGVAIPESAIVEDNGKPTAFVMEGGESFFKRTLKLGVRSGGFVQVLEGVSANERVVSRGAYELKLSTATGAIPEHGHQH